MLNLIETLVLYILVPLFYLSILLFDFILIVRSRTLENRWRNLAGVMVGFLIGTVVTLLDQNFGLFMKSIENYTLESFWLGSVIFAVTGFLALTFIDFLLRRGVVSFVIVFTVAGIVISGYFLLFAANRLLISTITMGFVVGSVLYFIIFPTRISNSLLREEE
jgi:hypothetical protein